MAKMSFEAWNLTRNLRQRRWIVGLLIFLLISLLVINSFTINQFQIVPLGNNTIQGNYVEAREEQVLSMPTAAPVQKGYVVNNKGCRIPDLSPFETSAMRYFKKLNPIVCAQGTHLPLVNSNSSAIFVDPEALPHYYNENETAECCWRSFWRVYKKDNKVRYSNDCHAFTSFAYINDEFVKVECQGKNGSGLVYQDYFAFVPRKLHVEDRCHKLERMEKLWNKKKPDQSSEKKLSVLIVGIDSVSRLNFHRLMPRTLGKLKELGALELYGYNKVADNTYPNMVPVLSGYSVTEFEKLCWTNHDRPFDKCPFIWNKFKSRGYRTIFAEDACWMSIFNYLKPGFSEQPTDYYLRPFCHEMESVIGNTQKYNAKLCVGTRLTFDYLLHYTRKVAEQFADDPYFGLFWQASLTHDDVQYPQFGDDSYYEFFQYLQNQELLRNTALIFMSDHGMRWGGFRQTYQGRLEDSLPFVFLLFPDWWKQLHPQAWKNLQTNARSLTSPFDLHEVLENILEPKKMNLSTTGVSYKDKSIKIPGATDENKSAVTRGISLFKAIPVDRSCDSAGIPEHWCMCQTRYNVSADDPVVIKTLKFFESQINQMLSKYPQCSRLEISKLIDAKALSHTPSIKPTTSGTNVSASNEKGFEPYWTDYSITTQMSPGGAIFESSIRYHPENDTLSLVDSISRLNSYGNQSACVDDFRMRLYCYCPPHLS